MVLFHNAFMEFQAYNVLVASDIRQLEHIEYTPAPDIIHEGWSCTIIANQNMRNTSSFGEWLQSNFFAQRLRNVWSYPTAFNCEEAEETPQATIDAAEKSRGFTKQHGRTIRNGSNTQLHWWTVEWINGTVENPKIYGAGLLSSIGESALYDSGSEENPCNISAANQSFDIHTTATMFTPTFAYLDWF
jgi:phenylalanine-4-hydroxylase